MAAPARCAGASLAKELSEVAWYLEKNGAFEFRSPYSRVEFEEVKRAAEAPQHATAFVLVVEEETPPANAPACGSCSVEEIKSLNVAFVTQRASYEGISIAVLNCLLNVEEEEEGKISTHAFAPSCRISDPDQCRSTYDRICHNVYRDRSRRPNHFIALVRAKNHVVELSDRLHAPIDHGFIKTDFVAAALNAVRSILDHSDSPFWLFSMQIS